MAAPYATAAQLAAAVRVSLTPANTAALELCIDAASAEIDHACDRPEVSPMPEPTPPLVTEVCIARALEWWKANDSAFGVLGFEGTGVLNAPRDGFGRHAVALVPYQIQFGIA